MMIICPSCKRETLAGMRFCRNCGRLLGDPDLDAAYAPAAPYFDRVNDVMGDVDSGAPVVDVTHAHVAVYVYPTDEHGEVTGLATPIGEYSLGGRDATIGRGKGSDIVLAGDTLASRRHAMLRRDHDRYLVVDLGSSNGTLLNGTDLSEAAPLRHGDRVQVGNHELVYLLDISVQMDGTNAPQVAPMGLDAGLTAGEHEPSSAWAAPAGSDTGAAETPSMTHPTAVPAVAVAQHAVAQHAVASAHTANSAGAAHGMGDRLGASGMGGVGATGIPAAVAVMRAATQPAPPRGAAAPDLSGIRAKLVEAGEALAQEARTHATLANQMRDALSQTSTRLREIAADLRGGPAGATWAASAIPPNDLILLARRVRENPNDLERLRAFSDRADAIEGALLTIGQADHAARALEQLSVWLDAQVEAATSPGAPAAVNETTGER